jgi:hypothetical protein
MGKPQVKRAQLSKANPQDEPDSPFYFKMTPPSGGYRPGMGGGLTPPTEWVRASRWPGETTGAERKGRMAPTHGLVLRIRFASHGLQEALAMLR